MSKVDKLKERLIPFVKEETSETQIKIPYRVICGFKLDVVAVILQDLLRDKYTKQDDKTLKFVSYEDKDDGFVFNFIQEK
jgi:hypothetical protein